MITFVHRPDEKVISCHIDGVSTGRIWPDDQDWNGDRWTGETENGDTLAPFASFNEAFTWLREMGRKVDMDRILSQPYWG